MRATSLAERTTELAKDGDRLEEQVAGGDDPGTARSANQVSQTPALITKNERMDHFGQPTSEKQKQTIVCAICQRSFSRRRSTARFCSPRCRQRAHRRTDLSPFNDPKSADGGTEGNDVKSTRGPCNSAAGTASRAERPTLDSNTLPVTSAPRLVRDQTWPNMWRLSFPNGRLSVMTNLTRAKDALARAEQRNRRSSRSKRKV